MEYPTVANACLTARSFPSGIMFMPQHRLTGFPYTRPNASVVLVQNYIIYTVYIYTEPK